MRKHACFERAALALGVAVFVATLAGTAAIVSAAPDAESASVQEKKRVPKDKDSDKDKDKDKEDSRAGQSTSQSSDDESCLSSCISDAILGLFTGSGEETSDAPPPGSASLTPLPGVGSPERRVGVIQHPDTPPRPVPVWDRAGGTLYGATRIGALVHGTDVEITDTRIFGADEWFEVHTLDEVPVTGWVSAGFVNWTTEQGAPAASAPPPVTVTTPRPPQDALSPDVPPPLGADTPTPAWTPGLFGATLGLDVSWLWLPGPSEVREEYSGGARFGLTAIWLPAGSLQLTLAPGFAMAFGDPKYDYETTAQRDTPTESRIMMVDVAFRIGQYVGLGEGATRFYWGLGPLGAWVRESANLEIRALPSENWIGSRSVSLHRLRLGADVALGLTHEMSSAVHIGILARGFVVPWHSRQQESLTLDFIGDKSLVGFGIALVGSWNVF